MKFLSAHFVAKAGVLSEFLVMAVLGWNLADALAPASKEPAGPEGKTRRADRVTRRSIFTGPGTLAGQRLDAIRAAKTPEARLSATLALANSLSPEDIAAWLSGGWFNVGGGPEQLLFRNLLLARWSETDPEGVLAWSFRNNTKADPIVIDALADKEPGRGVDFFRNHPDKAAELEVLQAVAAIHPALALQRLQELAAAGISSVGLEKTSGLLRQLAETSPAGLAAALESLPPPLRKQAEVALCGQRLATSFSTEIRALWDRPDGSSLFFRNLDQNPELRGKLWEELANLPPHWKKEVADGSYNLIRREDTEKWLDADLESDGFTARQAQEMRKSAMKLLAWHEPEDALARMDELKSGTIRREDLIDTMFLSLADDPERADTLMARLGSDEERERARQRLIIGKNELINRNGRSNEAKVANPAEWLEGISRIDPGSSANSFPYLHEMERWDAGKVVELSEQFAAMSDDQKRQVSQAIVAGGRSYDSPFTGTSSFTGEAIRYLVGNPVARQDGQNDSKADPVRIASEYASKLAFKDPGAASDWVASLPAGDARLWAQKNVAKNWAIYDPKAAGQWVASLPVDARSEVRAFMTGEK